MAAIWGYAEPLRVLCVRQYQVSIKESFHAELKAAIDATPWLAANYDVGRDYLRSASGSEFIFRGIERGEASIKSLAKVDLTIVEEAEDLAESSWLALEATVFRQPKSELWAIWNPRTENSPVDRRFRLHRPERSLVTEINWQDNPFFPDGLDELRRRQQSLLDPATYAHIWEGAYLTNSDAQVFAGKVHVDAFEPGANWDGPYYGGDFGFSQDPTAVVKVWINGSDVFISHEGFKTGLELDDTPAFAIKSCPGIEREVSRWDSANPSGISHIKRHGLPRATGAEKWQNSVEEGVRFLRSFGRIVIHPRCTNVQQEARLYSYKVDRQSGDVTSNIIDAHNHGWDAVRYALAPMVRKKPAPNIRIL